MAFSLKLLGGVSLEGDGGPLPGPAVQRHRLALLALLAASRNRSVLRDKLMAWLWPERDAEHARALLNQAVHVLRRTLGNSAIQSVGEELQLDAGLVRCDLIGFEEARNAGQLEQAAALYGGPFLDGFFLSEAPEFERWVERERDRLATAYARVLDDLAKQAGGEDRQRAVELWKAKVAHDPFDSGAVLQLMEALAASGNRAAALQAAETHQRLLREEFGIEPSAEVLALAATLRAVRPAGVPPPLVTPSQQPREVAAATPAPAGAGSSDGPTEVARKRGLLPYGVAATLLAATLLAIRWGTGKQSGLPAASELPAATVDQIADAVARELARRERGDTAATLLPEQRTRSIPAYELYLRGKDPVMVRSDSTARLALDYFRRAVALDSSYAAAWAGLARLLLRTDRSPRANGFAVRREAAAAAARALALNDSLAEAHFTLGLVRYSEARLAEAEAEFHRAGELDPRTSLNHEWLSKLYIWMGRDAEALAEARRALELNPAQSTAVAELARALLANGRSADALAELGKLAGLEPPLQRVPGILAQCYAQQGKWAQALATIRTPAEQGDPTALGLQGYFLARSGDRSAASRVLDQLLQRTEESDTPWSIALVYFGLGELERAKPWVERGTQDFSMATELLPLAAQLLQKR